jgi:hypothetical protein
MVDALVDGTSVGTCWCMVDALVYGIGRLHVVWYRLLQVGWL